MTDAATASQDPPTAPRTTCLFLTPGLSRSVDVPSAAPLWVHLDHRHVEFLQHADDLGVAAVDHGVECGFELLVEVQDAHGHAPRERLARHGVGDRWHQLSGWHCRLC